ncbi:HNH endonuclease [Actinacidiphila sp. bgisy160]|uniref:HNH endonuclease n=1 Tax=Actinacidiphila sp. bgisy160 TaxID=3413796 RepID=UPI003D72DA45
MDYAKLLELHGLNCHLCGEPIQGRGDLHFDHVVPLARGGAHSMDNIRPAHMTCNLRKAVKFVFELPWARLR